MLQSVTRDTGRTVRTLGLIETLDYLCYMGVSVVIALGIVLYLWFSGISSPLSPYIAFPLMAGAFLVPFIVVKLKYRHE